MEKQGGFLKRVIFVKLIRFTTIVFDQYINSFLKLALLYVYEDTMQNYSGKFNGIMRSFVYLKNGKLYYNDLERQYSDSFANNQFVGEWISYKTGINKKCCWGNFRIPYCGDLDIGAGGFSPNEKYLNNGWKIYHNAYYSIDKNVSDNARKEEEKKWW